MAFNDDQVIMKYVPSNTGALFHADKKSIVKGLMGPIGSGKSVTCVIEMLRKSWEQAPNSKGIRKSRWAVIRNTYAELKTTTIATFKQWVPCDISSQQPFVANVWDNLPDGTRVEAEFIFIALNRPQDTKKLLSMEITGAWINEAREIPEAIFTGALSRTGRYPNDSPLTWAGVIMDTNPPDTDSWYYKYAESEKKIDGFSFYRQPGALIEVADGNYIPNPAAENINHLKEGYKYYTKQITPATDKNLIRVQILAQYGTIADDRPVYDMFNEQLHAAKPLDVIPNLPLLLMFDFGLTPVCLFGQIRDDGQLRIYDERCCEYGGLKQFVKNDVVPLLNKKYRGFGFSAVCDPAGNQKMQVDDTLTCIGELKRCGIDARAAVTNDFMPRVEAVRELLGRLVNRGEPALVIDPLCRRLVKGFISGYHFRRVLNSKGNYADAPEKNMYSHPHDALQYGALEAVRPYRKQEKVMAAGGDLFANPNMDGFTSIGCGAW